MGNDNKANGKSWIGFDLDGTLAEFIGWKGIEHIGKPVQKMCDKIKELHAQGKEVKIVTARVAPREGGDNPKEARRYIEEWCKRELGFVPEITHEKDSHMECLYDDRAKQVIPNKGIPIEEAAKEAVVGKKNDSTKALKEYLEK